MTCGSLTCQKDEERKKKDGGIVKQRSDGLKDGLIRPQWYLTDLLVDPDIRIRKTTAVALIHLRQKFFDLNCYVINCKAINSY